MTLTSCLVEAAHRFGDAPAYVGENGLVLSYVELERATDEVAAGLLARGIGQGDVVALVLPTIPEYVVAYLAAAKVGAITAGVNIRLSAAERDGVLAVADPKLVLTEADVLPAASVDELLADVRIAGAGL